MNQTSLARTDDSPAPPAPERALEATGSGPLELVSGAGGPVEDTTPPPAPAEAPTSDSQPTFPSTPTSPSTMFAGFISGGVTARTRRLRRLTVAFSMGIHAALLAVGAAASFWTVDELSAPRVVVTFLALPVAPPPPPPAARKAAERPRPRRPLRQPVVQPQELTPPPADEAADKDDSAESGQANGTSGGVAGGVVGAVSDAPPPRAPELSAHERQALIRRYLEQVVGPRIRSRLRMPPEAERLGLEGQVVLQASIDGSGRLLGLRPVGACAFEVLCEDAARTIRESAPFPAPPPALVEGVVVDVPVNYRLQ